MEGYRRLAASILLLAIRDAKKGDEDAVTFLYEVGWLFCELGVDNSKLPQVLGKGFSDRAVEHV